MLKSGKLNVPFLFSFVEAPRKFTIAELSIRKPGPSSVLTTLTIIIFLYKYKKLKIYDYIIEI